ncbi:MAG TPA: RNA 3'-terminal phosphate cyclase [Armatimonadota bacterium]|jgi:RNA 3'-terminal phosphate cyclase (ATP)
MTELTHIDGSYGEGGGQIIRTALSLSAITGKAIEITQIRAKRAKPGLQPQHLTAVHITGDLCAARLEGAAVGSTRLLFTPQAPVAAGNYRRDIGTAGAIALVIQTALLPLALRDQPSHVLLIGGTHVNHAPSSDYLETVYLPALRRLGVEAQMSCPRAGFFPRGGGDVLLDIMPTAGLRPLDLTERGKLRKITAIITTSGLPSHVAERGAATVTSEINKIGLGRDLTVEQREKPSNGPGAAVLLAVECDNGHAGFSALGERGKPMERVAEEACRDFHAWWQTGATCDEHLADQLVLPLALANAESRWTTPTCTEHLRTVIWLVEQLLPVNLTVTEQTPGQHLVVLRPR